MLSNMEEKNSEIDKSEYLCMIFISCHHDKLENWKKRMKKK